MKLPCLFGMTPQWLKRNIEVVDILRQDLCFGNELFGGKIIIFGGDFLLQVLPVLPKRTLEEAIQSSLVIDLNFD